MAGWSGLVTRHMRGHTRCDDICNVALMTIVMLLLLLCPVYNAPSYSGYAFAVEMLGRHCELLESFISNPNIARKQSSSRP